MLVIVWNYSFYTWLIFLPKYPLGSNGMLSMFNGQTIFFYVHFINPLISDEHFINFGYYVNIFATIY